MCVWNQVLNFFTATCKMAAFVGLPHLVVSLQMWLSAAPTLEFCAGVTSEFRVHRQLLYELFITFNVC